MPLRTLNPAPGTDELIDSPGARRERKGATSENQEIPSDFDTEPTLTADGTHAGLAIDHRAPLLPDAAIEGMPIDLKLSIAGL